MTPKHSVSLRKMAWVARICLLASQFCIIFPYEMSFPHYNCLGDWKQFSKGAEEWHSVKKMNSWSCGNSLECSLVPRLFAESPVGRRGATDGDGLSAPSVRRHSSPGSRGALGRGPGRRTRVSGARLPAASLGKERGSEWAAGGGARGAGGVDAAGFGKAPSE